MDPAEILTARRELGRWIASAGQTGQALPMLREVLAASGACSARTTLTY